MRKIPVLAVIRESYGYTFLDNAYFLNVGWRTFGVLIIASIAIDVLEMFGFSAGRHAGMAFALLVIPYVICCYQFTVDGTLAPSPKLLSLANSQPHYKQIYKTFIKNYVALNFIVGIILAAGFVMFLIRDNQLQTRLIGLALVPGSFILWLALSFLLPASATGRDTSFSTSAKQLWGNYLRYLFVVLTACIPFVALIVGASVGSAYLEGLIPEQALTIMAGLMGCLALMLLSTMLSIAVGASYREIVCAADECAPAYETGTPIHPK